jgi:serine/threonine protein kinase
MIEPVRGRRPVGRADEALVLLAAQDEAAPLFEEGESPEPLALNPKSRILPEKSEEFARGSDKAVSTLEDGQTIGHYRIERFLGAGAMGEVYLAQDPHIERPLAIKTVKTVRLAGPPQEIADHKKSLLREARAAGRLLHPNIVTLFDAGEAGDIVFLAFEFVEGPDLSSRVGTPPPLSLREVLHVLEQSADALDHAHRQEVVHRDIKPSNILLDKTGRVKVADFGFAKLVGQSTELNVAGAVVGSPQYLSPEQIRGEELDGRSDIFSLGVVLFELLSGQRPFDGDTITTLVYQILHKEPPRLSELRDGIPPRLEELLSRMLAKDREERYATAAQVAEELRAIERDLPDATLAAPALADLLQQVPTPILSRRKTADIIAELVALVAQDAYEEDLHEWIERHPWIITGIYNPNVVVSKPPLGADHVPDFAYFSFQSGGAFIQLVEIESPRLEVFTAGDEFTARFNHAVQQLADWEDWCLRHQDALALLIEPLSCQGFLTNLPSFTRVSTLLIAGRRSNILANSRRKKRWEKKVNEIGDRTIRTWEGFIETLPLARFEGFADWHYTKCVRYSKQGYTEVLR